MLKSTPTRQTGSKAAENIRHAGWKYKLGLLGLFSMAYLIFYVYPNFNPPVEPRDLPLLLIDRIAPFLPWTFIVYLSEFFLIAAAIVLIKDLERFNSFTRLTFIVLGIIGPIFYFFPTSYPRLVYPAEENIVITFARNVIKTL